jgi:hypothetical protein
VVGPLHQLDNPHEWFDTSSFVKVPTSSNGTPVAPGDSPRNPFTGAGTKTMDLNISKTFAVAERFKVGFEGDFFNLFNTVQFNQPDGNMNDGGAFGTVTSIRYDSQREIQLGLRVTF